MWNAAAKLLLLIAGALLGVATMTGCASVKPVIKVGLVAPFEGRHRAVGYDAIYSARLAVREINADGGIGGHRVALVALDDRGDPRLARQAAATLAVDPAVVAVAGHFLADTTDSAADIYTNEGMALVRMGEPPFDEFDATLLPDDFLERYASITPFDETAGPFAGPTYDAFGLLWQALAMAEQTQGDINRESVQAALSGLEYEGVTGVVYWP